MVWFNDHLSSNCKHACLEIESFPWHDDSRNRHLQLVLLDKGCLMSTIFKAFQRVKGKVHETCFLACLKNPRGCWQVTMEGVSTWMYSVRDEAKRADPAALIISSAGLKKPPAETWLSKNHPAPAGDSRWQSAHPHLSKNRANPEAYKRHQTTSMIVGNRRTCGEFHGATLLKCCQMIHYKYNRFKVWTVPKIDWFQNNCCSVAEWDPRDGEK